MKRGRCAISEKNMDHADQFPLSFSSKQPDAGVCQPMGKGVRSASWCLRFSEVSWQSLAMQSVHLFKQQVKLLKVAHLKGPDLECSSLAHILISGHAKSLRLRHDTSLHGPSKPNRTPSVCRFATRRRVAS